MTGSSKNKIKHNQLTNKISSFKTRGFEWIDFENFLQPEIFYFQSNINVAPNDVEDVLSPIQRSKIITRDDYIFIILLFPSEKSDIIRPLKISFFIFKNKIITIHSRTCHSLNLLKELFFSNTSPQTPSTHKSFLYILLSRLYEDCLPIINRISNDIDQVEEEIFSKNIHKKNLVKKIFTIERQIVDVRRIIRNHPLIIDKLINSPQKSANNNNVPFVEIANYPKIIWTNLESQMEAIDTLRETHESLQSFWLNDIIKTLTIISIIIAPLTLISGIFGMNFRFIPLAFHINGFYFILEIMVIISLIAFLFFKRKRWL